MTLTSPQHSSTPATGTLQAYSAPLRWAAAALLVAYFCVFAVKSWHWPWMNDSQVFHYIIFLIGRGLSPYRQIVDINMPGSYLSEFVGMSLFGWTDIGWRLYDYSLLAALTAACIYIAAPVDWLAGLLAGVMFALIHGSEGPWQTAQRDEVVAILCVAGFALFFFALRRGRPGAFFAGSLLISFAASIKPTAIVALAIIGVAAWRQLHISGRRVRSLVWALLLGPAAVALLTVAFLLWRNSLPSFLHRVTTITAFYATLNPATPAYLLQHSTPRGALLLLAFAIPLAVAGWRHRDEARWERIVILAGAIFGLLSYLVQKKGYTYHRYPFVAFLLLWISLELFIALRRGGAVARAYAAAGITVALLLVAPFYVYRLRIAEQNNQMTLAMVEDLRNLHAQQLQQSVQCLDGITGCYSALFRLRVQQSTGIMGDQLLFTTRRSPVVDEARDEFSRQIATHPPAFFVESNYWFGGPQSFALNESWPQFAAFLRRDYTIVVQRTFPLDPGDKTPIGYRIYRHR